MPLSHYCCNHYNDKGVGLILSILTARHLVTVIIKLLKHFITSVIHHCDELPKVFNFFGPVTLIIIIELCVCVHVCVRMCAHVCVCVCACAHAHV